VLWAAAAFLPAVRRLRVVAAFRPAARRLRAVGEVADPFRHRALLDEGEEFGRRSARLAVDDHLVQSAVELREQLLVVPFIGPGFAGLS